jgi:L-aspartate-alpha-decarboxylase
MMIHVLKSKIHRAVVTQAELNYVGSITIDVELLEKSGIREYEQVHVVDIDNGNRLVTYAIAGERHSGVVCLNGAAARLVQVGDKVIVMAYAMMDEKEMSSPTIVFVDEKTKCLK